VTVGDIDCVIVGVVDGDLDCVAVGEFDGMAVGVVDGDNDGVTVGLVDVEGVCDAHPLPKSIDRTGGLLRKSSV